MLQGKREMTGCCWIQPNSPAICFFPDLTDHRSAQLAYLTFYRERLYLPDIQLFSQPLKTYVICHFSVKPLTFYIKIVPRKKYDY